MLTVAIGPVWVWAAVGAGLWTPLAGLLRRATRRRALWLGALVAGVGIVALYVLFVFHMGAPGSGGELAGAFVFFPLFVISAVAWGGFLAIPATLATALLLRQVLSRLIPLSSAPGAV